MPEPGVANLLTLEVETAGDVAVIKCHGKLVSGVTDVLYNQVSHLFPTAKRIVLDLSDLTYMDSMGLGTLVRLYASCKSRGITLELVNLGKRIRELLSLTNLLSVFAIVGEHGTTIRM
jgi:anti-sigma B factor antagonist